MAVVDAFIVNVNAPAAAVGVVALKRVVLLFSSLDRNVFDWRVPREINELFSTISDRIFMRLLRPRVSVLKLMSFKTVPLLVSTIANSSMAESTNSSRNLLPSLTTVAFMPSVSSSGKVLFSLFQNGRYNIAIIDKDQSISLEKVGYEPNYFSNHIESELILGIEMSSKLYDEEMLSISIIPKIMIDYNTVKPGAYFFSSEVIDRFSFFGGFSARLVLPDFQLR